MTSQFIEEALARLDLETKVKIMSGQDMWSLPAVPEIGLSSLVVSDGPIGVRGTGWTADDPAIALPSPTALAATWDPDLARRAGRLLGQEARRKGVHVLLAPTVNLHRSPLGGRHFEAYSEDPLLTSEIGVGYVSGVQEHSVGVTVKHFVANDSETERMSLDAHVSERALRELYLAPFEAIVKRGGAWGVMSAYNQVNGSFMTEHSGLQNDVLKGEWGFDGAIVSDWFAAHDTEGAARGGLDIAMPAVGSPWGERLVAAVRRGDVAIEVIDEAVRRILLLACRTGAVAGVDAAVPESGRPAPVDGDALAREIATRSFVLTRNEDALLPLNPARLRRVALIGALAKHARVLGGGSAQVFPDHIVSPLDGLVAALPDGVELTYATGADPRTKLAPANAPAWRDLTATFFGHDGAALHTTPMANGAGLWMELPGGIAPDALAAVEIAGRLTAAATGTHELGVRGIGQFTLTVDGEPRFGDMIMPEGTDMAMMFLAPPERRIPVDLAEGATAEVRLRQQVMLSPEFALVAMTLGYGEPSATADEQMAAAIGAARDADVAIIVVGTTEEVESEGFDRTTLALPGRQDELVRAVLAVNPRTVVVVNAGSPVELPWADEVPSVLLTWFPGQEAGHALADVLLGHAEPGGRLPTTWPVAAADCPVLDTAPVNGVLAYDEGVFIGYRAWDRTGVAPRYPFGHGLGYTAWAFMALSVEDGVATVTLRNDGSRQGREVVQLYVAPVTPDDARPVRWLAGFATASAAPGETVEVSISLPERAFQIWEGGWTTVPGDYHVEAARSLADRPLSTVITIK